MELSSESAEKIMNALSAFKTYKKPKTLPDRLRLSRKHLQNVKRWRNMAKRKLKRGTFTSLTQLAGYLPLDIQKQDDIVVGPPDQTVSTPGTIESSLSDLYNDCFPDFFDFDGNDWDEDWKTDDDGDDNDANFTDPFGNSVNKSQIRFDGQVGENRESFVDGMSGMMENFAGIMMPAREKIMAKEICCEPYKKAKEVFETWLNENRELLSHDVIREKENQLKLYTEIVDVYEQMDDNDDDEKARADMNKVQALIAKISAIFGQLPAEVLSAQDEAATSMLKDNLAALMRPFEEVIPKMDELLAGFMNSFLKTSAEADTEEEGLDKQTENCTIL